MEDCNVTDCPVCAANRKEELRRVEPPPSIGVWTLENGRRSGGEGEILMKDPLTGGEKGAKQAEWGLLPFAELNQVAEVYGYGATKYAPRNWQKGYSWTLSLSALGRHLALWASGESKDKESGLSHLAHACFHLLALMYFEKHHPTLNDIHLD
jgi:hypothetical protein